MEPSLSLFDETLKKYSPDHWYFVETGTFKGGGAIAASHFFPTVITIETDVTTFMGNYKKLVALGILPMLGHSPWVLKDILPFISPDSSVFYLDAHTEKYNPLESELFVIKHYGGKNSILLIDDVRAFGNAEHGPAWGRFTLDDVKRWCWEINPNYVFSFEDTRNGPNDLLVAVPE